MTSKKCIKCGETKELNLFAKRGSVYRNECKQCKALMNKIGRKKYELKAKYNIDVLFYQEEIIKQDGCCVICKKKDALVVDHCHKTGSYRGLLCNKCNIGLGHFNDDPELMEEASNYVRKSQT